MRFPSKITTYENSILSFLIPILNIIEKNSITKIELFKMLPNMNINNFIDCLNILYALKKIKYNYQTRRIEYVKENPM